MWDAVWQDIFRGREWGQYPSEDVIRFVARNFYGAERRSDVRILEVGCGPGANLWYLAREGFTFAGIDGSEMAIEKAAARLDAECPGWRDRGELTVGDISSLPWADEYFYAVIDNEAIYANAFEDSCLIYAEMARVLRQGGVMYSKTFAKESWGEGTGQAIGKNMWSCTQGPLAGKGASRFTSFSEIPELTFPFSLDSVELLTRTCDDRKHKVSEWLITGTKK